MFVSNRIRKQSQNRIRKQSQKVTIAAGKNFTKTGVALGHCLFVREQGSARSQLHGILVLHVLVLVPGTNTQG